MELVPQGRCEGKAAKGRKAPPYDMTRRKSGGRAAPLAIPSTRLAFGQGIWLRRADPTCWRFSFQADRCELNVSLRGLRRRLRSPCANQPRRRQLGMMLLELPLVVM